VLPEMREAGVAACDCKYTKLSRLSGTLTYANMMETMTNALRSMKIPKSVLFPPPGMIKPPMFRIPYFISSVLGVPSTLFFTHDLDRLAEAHKRLLPEEALQLKAYMKSHKAILDQTTYKWRWVNPQASIYVVDP
jgi:hypothetical protein